MTTPSATLVRLCATGDLPSLQNFFDTLLATIGAQGHLHPAYDALDRALCSGLAARYGTKPEPGRAQIAAELVLTTLGPSSRVRAAVRRAAAGDPRGLTSLVSAEERVLAFAATCAALDQATN
ncbi:hypothetical protein ACF08W_34555 [Streptomyces sp. NPDC015144]|uniref:hypothetical protein n=1 Tax=Streptomyces sp. NPDC015144 TaxID=3364944 RepID=UPI0036FC6F43